VSEPAPSVTRLARTILVVGADTPIRHAFARLIEALGAAVVCRRPGEPVADELAVSAVVALGDDMVAALQPDQLAPALAVLRRHPLLLVGLGANDRMLEGLADVTGARLTTASPTRLVSYAFAADATLLWPFAGLCLSEQHPRVVTPLNGDDRALHSLISTPAGHIMCRLSTEGPAVYVSTVSGWEGGPPPVLWRSFRPESFLDTLPVMVFAREALAGDGWARPTRQATCIVDDPNLRRVRYGHLDFRAAVRLARECPFHLSVGFVPLDYRSTSMSVAQLFHAHPEALSLLIHGNDHRRLELAREVPDSLAEKSVRQALARMDRHQAATGLVCPAVMTPPHGACTRPWVRALRAAGYVAAVATATHPYADNAEDEGAGELHELFCAELSLYGFPIVVRYPLMAPRERLLFAAWLGKPLIIYVHHSDFAGGAEELRSRVDFINDRVAPRWASITDVVRDNYQLRTAGRAAAVRVFSNDVIIRVPDQVDEVVVAKEGRDIPWRSEAIMVDGRPVTGGERSETTLRVVVPTEGRSQVRVRFVPEPSDVHDDLLHVNPRSRARRTLTEARDRLAPAVGGVAGRLDRSRT
jgi:hypothetical protein